MKKAIMKKLTVVMVVAAVVFGAASGAMAASDFDMILTMYGYQNADGVNQNGVSMNKTFGDKEASYNLGMPVSVPAFEELYAPGGANASLNFDTGIFLSDLISTNVDAWADVQLAFYCSAGNPGDFPSAGSYFGAVSTPTLKSTDQGNFDSGHRSITTGGVIGDAGTAAVYGTDDANSYVKKMNAGVIGVLSGILGDSQNGELNLAALDTAGGTAELMLYKAEFTSEGVYDAPVQLGTFTFSLDTDGSLLANYNAVPVPAPLLLLGSGLLGLIGFRRKRA